MPSKEYERTTVYLTTSNKKRFASLNRGEKMRLLNEAIDQIFAKAERSRAFKNFSALVATVQPVDPVVPSDEAVARARSGRG